MQFLGTDAMVLWFVVIEAKSVTHTFIHLGGAGDARGSLMVLLSQRDTTLGLGGGLFLASLHFGDASFSSEVF
jgi:hypothetical protein